ncbi:MAG: tetratricopeptide repeat protein [Acidobacteria bacterium]|nr:tetratricopeptide repeat protein [Acidobacteriota bacterium]
MRQQRWLLLAAVCVAAAQDGAWEQEMRHASRLQAEGKYAAAEKAYTGLLNQVGSLGPDHPRVITTTHNLGNLYHEMERFAEAEKLYLTSTSAWERLGAAGSQYMVRALINLAALYAHAGQFAQADRVYRRLDALVVGSDTADAGRYYQEAAYLHFRRGNYSQAETLCRKALAVFEKVPGGQNPDVAATLNNLGMIRMTTNRPDEALPFFEQALAIWETTAGRDNPAVIVPLINIASFRVRERKFPEAHNLLRRAFMTAETTYGENSPVTARAMSSYAAILRKVGRKSEARLLERRLKAIETPARPNRPPPHVVDAADLRP